MNLRIWQFLLIDSTVLDNYEKPWIGMILLLNPWIKSFLEIGTKPWICEDRELGGRELGGYTVLLTTM